MLLSKGVDIGRLDRKHTYVSSQSGQIRRKHASTAGMDLNKYRPKASHLAKQDLSLDDLTDLCRRTNADGTVDDRCYLLECPVGSTDCEPQQIETLAFAESILYGVVDGIVAYFSNSCHDGLFAAIYAAFRIVDHWQIWYPWNAMKF